MSKSIAICSCPRLGFMDFMGSALVAFANNNVITHNAYGVYWGQGLSEAIQMSINEGFDYIFSSDYDGIFTSKEVGELIRLMDENPEADCICAVQMSRFGKVMVATESGKLNCNEVKEKDLIPIIQGHFGLTIFRATAFKDLKKPWIVGVANSDGEWTPGSDKVDDDVYFWRNFVACGKKLFLAPRVVAGHMDVLIKWPDEDMNGIYETTTDYNNFGAPSNVWK